MTFEYSKADLSNVDVGDKVVLRNGKIEVVDKLGSTVTPTKIGGYRYNSDGECFCVPSRDAVWVLGTNTGPVDLNEYDLEQGIYAIRSDGKVLVLTQFEPTYKGRPVKFAPVDDRDADFWYWRHGRRFSGGSDFYRIIEICAPKKAPKRVDLSGVVVGDKLKLRNGDVGVVIATDTSDEPVCAIFGSGARLWYRRNGIVIHKRDDELNDDDVVEIIKQKPPTLQAPLSLEGIKLKEGDTVLLRDGTTQIVNGVNLSGVPYKIGNLYYKSNGVCNTDVDGRANNRDVIALVERTAPKDEDYFKYLAVSLLSEISGDRLLSVPSSVVLEIVKGAHSDVEPNKVSTAFVALLEGFSRSNESIKLPAKALRDLISL